MKMLKFTIKIILFNSEFYQKDSFSYFYKYKVILINCT